MKYAIVLSLFLITIVHAQEKPRHVAEIARLQTEVDSLVQVQKQTIELYREQLNNTLQQLQGRINERLEKITVLRADTLTVRKKP